MSYVFVEPQAPALTPAGARRAILAKGFGWLPPVLLERAVDAACVGALRRPEGQEWPELGAWIQGALGD